MENIAQLTHGESDNTILVRFLRVAGVQASYHEAEDLARRADAAATEAAAADVAATALEVEAGRVQRDEDELGRRTIPWTTGMLAATLLAAIDAIPAYMAAQAFGADNTWTLAITALLVASLSVVMWSTAELRHGWWRRLAIGGLTAGLVLLGGLRYIYLTVTSASADDLSAVLEAFILTVFTSALVSLGVVVFTRTHSFRASAAMARAGDARDEATGKARYALALHKKAQVARHDLLVRAKVYVISECPDQDARTALLNRFTRELDLAD